MGFFDLFRNKRSKKKSDPASELFDDMNAFMNKIKEEEGTTLDQLPGHSGAFGFSPNNPILLTGIPETREYLEKLIYIKPGSSLYEWQRVGSTRSELVNAPIDEYNLVDPEGNIVKTIYIWPYNKVTSVIVPEGFGLMEL